ncbi:MAG: PAS domain S-box protein [Acidimicrobiia bacterium]
MTEPDADPAAWSPSWWQLREVLDAITDHVWIATPGADQVLYSNPAYETIFGEPAQTLLDDPSSFLALIADEDRAVVQRWNQPQPHEGTLRVRRRDDDKRVVRARNFPVRDQSGRVTLVAGISEDITSEWHLNHTLHETNERLAIILESTTDAVVALDQQWRIVFVNAKGAEIVGGDPADVLGRNIWAMHPDAFDHPFTRAYERVMATGVAETVEGYFEPWDRWFENTVAPTDEGIVIFIHDVTEQKRSAAAQRDQLRMLEHANVIVCSFDDRRVRYWSVGAERLYGYTAAEAEGQIISNLLHTEYPVPLEDLRADLVRDGRWTGTLKHHTKDGRTVTVASHLVLHRDDDTGEAVVVEDNNDITGLVDAMRESAQLRSELNRSERLDALGQLAGGIAHDFNNLLAVILNDLSFALDHLPAASPASVDVTNARRAAERAAALTRQLLVFAQRDTTEPSDVDLDHTIADLAPILERTAGDHIDVRVDLQGHGLAVHGDPSRFEQVLFNLVVNARDAMPYGGTLTIATTTDPEHDQLTLAVTDTGTGMSEEVRRQAFEPFYTTKPKGQGTGLGLSTVFGVATQCGGSASIDSTPGKGTTVTVRFPTTAPPPPTPPTPDDGRRRILLIEDDDELRRSTRQILRAAGHQVTTAASTIEATQVLHGQPAPDLVVTDLMLPGPPVMQLLTDLRETHPELPVIAVTGFPPAERDLLPPPFSLIPKPFTREQLTSTIARLLAI